MMGQSALTCRRPISAGRPSWTTERGVDDAIKRLDRVASVRIANQWCSQILARLLELTLVAGPHAGLVSITSDCGAKHRRHKGIAAPVASVDSDKGHSSAVVTLAHCRQAAVEVIDGTVVVGVRGTSRHE
jgi:hypothetical protein